MINVHPCQFCKIYATLSSWGMILEEYIYINLCVPKKDRLIKREEKSVWKTISILSMLQVKKKTQYNIVTLSSSAHNTRGFLNYYA